jgi:ABC-2 type transport system permease protein
MGAINGIIFWRALRDSRLSIIGWSVFMLFMGTMMIGIFPSIEGILEAFGPMLENPFMQSLVGDVEQFNSLEGFLSVKVFAMMPVILAVYVVLAALGIVAGEESRGTLDVLLSTPAPRWRVVVEKFAALAVGLVIITAMLLIGMLIGGIFAPDLELPVGKFAAAVLNMLPVSLFIGAFTLLLSTVVKDRSTAGGVAAGFIAISYFMTTLGDMIDGALGNIKFLSFYQYYDGVNVMTHGITWASFVALLVVALALFGASIYFFQRRDLLG